MTYFKNISGFLTLCMWVCEQMWVCERPWQCWEVGATWQGCRKQTRVLDNSELALNHWVTSPVPCINGLGFRVFVSISEEMVWTFSHFCDRKTWTAAPRTFNSKGPFWPSEDTIPEGSGSVLCYHVSESFLRQLKGPWLISWPSIS